MKKTNILLVMLIFSMLACNLGNVLEPDSTNQQITKTSTSVVESQYDFTIAPQETSITAITPSPSPVTRIDSGDQALIHGDWDKAILEYQQILDSSSNPELISAALLGIGRVSYLNKDFPRALEVLRTLVSEFPESIHIHSAYFVLGQVYDSLSRYGEAADAYQKYLSIRPGVIDFYVYEYLGDSLFKEGKYIDAISAYHAALQSQHVGDSLPISIKIGDAYADSGDLQTAIITYQDVYNRSNNDYIKAQMDLYMGRVYSQLGNHENAHEVYLDAVDNYPLSYDSYSALIELVNAGVIVNDLNRGLVDFFAGQYNVALSAFDRYLSEFPDDHPDSVHYYRGLTLRAIDQFDAAISEWEEQVSNHPEEPYWEMAYEQIAYTQWAYLDLYSDAVETLLDFVDSNPTKQSTPELLYSAGRISERAGNLEQSSEIWRRVGTDYPISEFAFDGFFLAGISQYRLGNYSEARSNFQSSLGVTSITKDLASAYLWIGKTYQQEGNPEEARLSWERASEADPTGYYSERAKTLLSGTKPFAPVVFYDLDFNEQSERYSAEIWMRSIFNLSSDFDLNGLGTLITDPRLVRGTELWDLGLYNKARLEFEDLRESYSNDAVHSYKLGIFLINLGLYRSGIFAMRQVLNLAGMDDAGTMYAPFYFNHIRFGSYFPEIVIPTAQSYNFDVLFIYSVIRQESLFEGFVSSHAGARGLMQIMPATGQGIADKLGWPVDYSSNDLYRPIISLTFGAEYLSAQRNYFNGELYPALAAYNAGPGNASIWYDLAENDDDLLLEIIRYRETQEYIRGIFEIFSIYKTIYQKIQ
jgi:soluble lytic murein transglycosylase